MRSALAGRGSLAAVAVFAALATLTHLPAIGRTCWSPDEGFLATQARVLAGGGRFYLDTVDRKPPLLAQVYALIFRLAGDQTVAVLHLLAIAAHTATAAGVAALAARRWGRGVALAAGALYLAASVGLALPDALAAGFETFMLPWTVAAVLAARAGRPLLAGLALAAATLTKQTAAVTLVPVLAALWWSADGTSVDRPVRWRRLGALTVGGLVPVLATALAFGPGRFAFWVLGGGGGGYLDAAGGWGQALARGAGNLGILVLADLAVVLLAARAVRLRRADRDTVLWLLAALVGVCAGFHFFGHYYLQLLPPLALLAAGGLVGLRPLAKRLAAGYTALAVLVLGLLAALTPAGEDAHAQRVAAAVRAVTGQADPILVWGMNPQVYWYADRPPATRFLTAGFLTGFAGGRPADRVGERYAVPGAWPEFDADLAARPPAVVVDDSAGAAYRPARVPRFAGLLSQHYRQAGTVDGAVLYRRAPG
jgi:4-amino-4-deoxy-L-arabinose transferase-like glycosyltransferase